MKKRRWSGGALAGLIMLGFAIGVLGLAGCAAPDPAGSVVRADALRSNKPRLPAPALDTAQVPELVAGNTDFAFDLYDELFDEEENLFYSPHSLSVALAMTYAGARGETERQMAEALHYTLPQPQLHPAFNALDQALVSRGEGEGAGAFRLHMANALWGQEGNPFQDVFLDTLAENYGAGLRIVDFSRTEEARSSINGWASDRTERRVQGLLPPGSIDGETVLVLTDAIYFKAAWMHAFAEEGTHDDAFTLLDGSQVTVPMMAQVAPLGYAERPSVQAVELPYAGDELSMVILLPEAGTFEPFAQALDAEELGGILSDMEPIQVRLTLPRFRFDAVYELEEALVALGMVDAFGEADFSGMDATHELLIDEVYHQASIAVDESGTEASAATAVVVARKGPQPEQEVRIGRPFIFLIRDIETGAILFLGHVVNPAT